MLDDELKEVYNKLQIFEKMYDIIRFVDPASKKILVFENKMIRKTDINCFDLWGKEKVCSNCISIRAYQEDNTIIKIEYSGTRVFMVTAIPVELDHQRVVIELMKDATNSLIFGSDGKYCEARSEIYAMIDGMNQMALMDSLTGIYNRRYISEKLPIDLANANLTGQNLSVIMADIDYFKKVNDTYGHLTGDCVLEHFAKILSTCVQRESDWVSRYGGEEFLICLPGSDTKKAVEIAEIMRKAVEDTTFHCKENSIQLTASFGVYSLNQNRNITIDDIIEQADKKLYLAKSNGRNRVEY